MLVTAFTVLLADPSVLTDEVLVKASALGERRWVLDSSGTGEIVADRQRLTQAIVQLADNAVRHTSEGDEVAIGSELTNGVARLWVRDSGPGIAPEDQQRIFERFGRGRSGVRTSEGAGLGLSIVKAIAVAHGSDVVVESDPGAGATFLIEIPVNGARKEVDLA